MHSDSATASNNLVPMTPKDFGKKKRVNRTAKLKQCKLDARREQWLSQVKRAVGKEEPSGGAFGTAVGNERTKVAEKPQIRANREEEHEGGGGGHIHHYSDCVSPSNSVMSHNGSVLEGIDSGTNFTGSSRSSVSSSRCSSSSRSGGSFSGSMSGEDEEGDDDCLDDWETVADALAATEEKQKHDLDPKSAPEDKKAALVDSPPDAKVQPVKNANGLGAKPDAGVSSARAPAGGCAWRPDDAFRPQSLPNLSKQYSFPTNSERYFGCGGTVWGCKNATVSAPTSCPICTEDLDHTDSSFSPCSCGFKLCLFCHKRILEDDGRCPGCRKPYKNDPVKGEAVLEGGSLTYRLARSCSMFTRS